MAGALLVVVPIVSDALLVAPQALFLGDRARTGQLYLRNTGTAPEEAAIDLQYGYPVSDSAGNVQIRLIDAPGPDEHPATEWVRAFPRRTVVQPGSQQVVRLLASPPADLPDGEYWSRIVVTSRGAAMPLGVADTAVTASIALQVRTILALMYRKGQVRTGVELNDFRASVQQDSLIVWLALARTGNAAYLGTIGVEMREPTGREIGSWDTQIAIYVPMQRRLAFPLPSLPAGTYTVALSISTRRSDLASSDVLRADPVQRSMAVETH